MCMSTFAQVTCWLMACVQQAGSWRGAYSPSSCTPWPVLRDLTDVEHLCSALGSVVSPGQDHALSPLGCPCMILFVPFIIVLMVF